MNIYLNPRYIYKWLFILLILRSLQTVAQPITFSNHVAPVIFQKCTPCHRPGQIGPMPMTNYEEVVSYAKMISYVTKAGYMPPWKPIQGPHALKDATYLTSSELQLIQEWVQNGALEGIPQQVPPVQPFDDNSQLNDPDLVVSMAEAFEQYGVYYDQYRVFVLPTHLDEDKMVSAIEFVPGQNTIVRGATISVDTSNRVQALDEWDPQYGYYSFGELGFVPYESRWYNWYPGKKMTRFNKAEGKLLPKGAKLLLHIHYGPTGIPMKDSSSIKLKFSKEKKVQSVITAPLLHQYNLTNDSFFIPANETIRYHAKFVVPFDIELEGVFPHSHLLGRSWDIFMVSPDGKASSRLLKIEDWDFNWKQMYHFEKALLLKKGTVVHALAEYDNTLNNPSNPSDPPRSMVWGKRMFEEMFMVYFSFKSAGQNVPKNHSFKILPGPVNITKPLFHIYFHTKKTTTFSFAIKDFEGNVCLDVFKSKKYKQGKHKIEFDLTSLKKGNYFMELKSGNTVFNKLFVYL